MYGASFAANKKPATNLEGNGVEQEAGGTSGTIMDDKSDKDESKDKGFIAESKNFAEAPDSKLTATNIL